MTAPTRFTVAPESGGGFNTRAAEVGPASLNEDARTFEVVFTTGARRRTLTWMEGEIEEELVVTAEAMDLTRLNDSAPFLNSHRSRDTRDVLGVVERAWISGGNGIALIRASESEEGERLLRDVRGRIITKVSVGYNVETYEVVRETGKLPLYRAVSWTPLEISAVPIPADANAHIRSAETPAAPAIIERSVMTPEEVLTAERERSTTILSLCDRHGLVAEGRAMVSEGVTVDEARTRVLDTLSSRDTVGRVTEPAMTELSARARPQTDRESYSRALAELVAPRTDATREPMFRSYSQMAEHWARANRVSFLGTAEAVRSFHTSGDFPLITANALGNLVGQALPQFTPEITRAMRAVFRDNLHPGNMLRLSAATELADFPEAAGIQGVTMNDDGEPIPVIQMCGGIFNLTDKAMRNDVLGVLNQTSQSMARSAVEKLRKVAVAPLLANSAAGQTMRDGVSLFHASRGNLAASGSAISVTSLAAATTAMRTQKDSVGQHLDIRPWGILVHPTKEMEARQVVAQITAAKTEDVNPYSGTLEVLVEPGLPAGNAWYVVGNPANYDGAVIAYLDDMASPQIKTREGWEVLGVEMRLVWALNAGFVSASSWYRNPGA